MKIHLDERGQATVEMLLAVLILALLSLGTIEIARGYAVKHAMEVGTAQAARGLSIDTSQWDWADTTIRREVTTNVLGGDYGSNLSIQLFDQAGFPLAPAQLNDAAAMPYGSVFWVRVSVPFVPHAPFLNLDERTMQVWHSGVVQRWP